MFSHRTDWTLTPNRFTQAQREILARGVELLDLTVSNPTQAELHYDAESILAPLVTRDALIYDPQPKGLRTARQSVATYYCESHEIVDLDLEIFILTTSTSEGYSYIFRLLCNPDDEILVPKPSYPLFEFLADLQDVRLIPYPLIYDHGWQIDFPSLHNLTTDRTRGIVVVHPNNPTGNYVSAADREGLNRFCHDHDLAIIADEVFLDYALDGAPRTTFAANSDVLTFTLSGISKISALPQMKLAWILTSGPAEKRRTAIDRLEVIADAFLSLNAPVQLAAAALLDERKSIQPLLLERLRSNLRTLDDHLARQKNCQRLEVEGGWYAVLRVPVTQSDEDLAIEILRKENVLVHPGHFYDFPGDAHLVLSLITPSIKFHDGAARILDFLNN